MTEFARRPRLSAGPSSSPSPSPLRPVAMSEPVTPREKIARYYRDRAPEYDRIYDRPERQPDLQQLQKCIQRLAKGRNVLEIACGTGYWTEVMSRTARSIVATDLNDTVMEIASQRDYHGTPTRFRHADAWKLDEIPGVFDLVFAGFWVSHLPRRQLAEFFASLDARMGEGGRVVLMDNRYVEGSSTPISRTDEEGNTYQCRTLDDGREFEIRKNFFDKMELVDLLDHPARTVEIKELDHYWIASYNRGQVCSRG